MNTNFVKDHSCFFLSAVSRSSFFPRNKKEKRKEADEADGERKKVRPSLTFGLEDGFTLISRTLKIWYVAVL
jgi:hypothetical protein